MKNGLKKLLCALLLMALLTSGMSLDVIAASVERPASKPFAQPLSVTYDDVLVNGETAEPGDDDPATLPDETETGGADLDDPKSEPPDNGVADPETATPEKILRYPDIPQTQSDYYHELYGTPVHVGKFETIYQIGENEYKAVISPVPNTYETDSGIEEMIDNRLFLVEESGMDVFANAANAMEVAIPAEFERGDGPAVTAEGYTVRLVPLSGDYSTAVMEENAIRYNDVFENVDVQYTIQEFQVKEDIILLAPTDRHTFRYRIDAPGLEARLIDGVVHLLDADGNDVFTIIAPVMVDAANDYSYELAMAIEGDLLTLTADSEWLNVPERVYPVKIDPTVVSTVTKQASGMCSPGNSRYYETAGRSVAGHVHCSWMGYSDDNTNITRSFIYFNDLFSSFTNTAGRSYRQLRANTPEAFRAKTAGRRWMSPKSSTTGRKACILTTDS